MVLETGKSRVRGLVSSEGLHTLKIPEMRVHEVYSLSGTQKEE